MGLQSNRLEITAPLSGVMVPLSSVPDPVFAQKMVGDGVSIDPTSAEMLAPISGTVVNLHKAHHALTIVGDSGVEVLVHIGIDTVELKGEGFTPLVKQGDKVTRGQPLIRFDLDTVGRKARSLLTQVLITNGDVVSTYTPATGLVTAGKSVALTLGLVGASGEAASEQSSQNVVLGNVIALPNPSGLHARPAAVLAGAAKKFTSDVRLVRGGEAVNAKSVVGIMGLSTNQGDPVQIKATGADAADAVAALTKLIAEGCGENPNAAPEPAPKAPAAPARAVATSANELAGVSASPGLAVGKIVQFRPQVIDVVEQGRGIEDERAKLDGALYEARTQLEKLKATLSADASKSHRTQILSAHQELLDDPDLIDQATTLIDQGKSAGFAWREAYSQYAAQLQKLESHLLRERANDMRDIGRRVLALLAGVKQAEMNVPAGSILVAEELAPSDTAAMDPSKVLGFCTTTGGATSHVAILARSLGIPAICGIEETALALPDGQLVVLDGTRGLLHRNPTEAEVVEARAKMERIAQKRAEEKAAAMEPAITTDQHQIEVVANIRNAKDAREAVKMGGEGVGLLRSEFLFDDRDTPPTQAEQATEYVAVAKALGAQRTLVIRTLDVGGDKPLPYMPLPKEDNPFLGLRGIRVSLDRPEMLRVQLRAILEAAGEADLHIMFPMVATIEELRAAKAILAEEMRASGKTAKVGIMIEVPSAAVMSEVFAREVDFFSIGTNDLTQYTLAMDRGHPKLAKLADGLDPAVLRMIALTVEGAHKHGKWVGVCGGIASDVMAVPVLIGLGVDELSVSVPAIPSVKALIKRLSLKECHALAKEVMDMTSAVEVRNRLAVFSE